MTAPSGASPELQRRIRGEAAEDAGIRGPVPERQEDADTSGASPALVKRVEAAGRSNMSRLSGAIARLLTPEMPARTARAIKLSEELGMPMPFVDGNEDSIEFQNQIGKFSKAIEKHDPLRRWLDDPYNAEFLKGDGEIDKVDTMLTSQKMLSAYTDRGTSAVSYIPPPSEAIEAAKEAPLGDLGRAFFRRGGHSVDQLLARNRQLEAISQSMATGRPAILDPEDVERIDRAQREIENDSALIEKHPLSFPFTAPFNFLEQTHMFAAVGIPAAKASLTALAVQTASKGTPAGRAASLLLPIIKAASPRNAAIATAFFTASNLEAGDAYGRMLDEFPERQMDDPLIVWGAMLSGHVSGAFEVAGDAAILLSAGVGAVAARRRAQEAGKDAAVALVRRASTDPAFAARMAAFFANHPILTPTVGEGITEGLQAISQLTLVAVGKADDEKTGPDGFVEAMYDPDVWDEVVGSARVGAEVGGFTGGSIVAAKIASHPLMKHVRAKLDAAEESKRIALSQSAAERLGILRDDVENTRLSQQSRAKVEEVLSDPEVDQDFTIDVDGFIEVFQSADLDPEQTATELGVEPEAFREAAATHGEITVRASRMMARLGNTPQYDAVVDHTRVDPGLPTPAEARKAEKAIQEQVDALAESAASAREQSAENRTAYEELLERLSTESQRAQPHLPQTVHDIYAALMATHAENTAKTMGVTIPEALRMTFNPVVIGPQDEIPGAGTTVNQIADPQFDPAHPLESEEFRAFFEGSEVVGADGAPLVMSHSTNQAFEAFAPFTHFGTKQAADERAETLRAFSEDVVGREHAPARVEPVYLSIKNALRIPDLATLSREGVPLDEARESALRRVLPTLEIEGLEFTASGQTVALDDVDFDDADQVNAAIDFVTDAFEEQDVEELFNVQHGRAFESLDQEDLKETLLEMGEIDSEEFEELGGAEDAIIELLESKGYDGIVYENVVEDEGNDSYIAFHPEQIKSVHNRGTFDPADPRILFQPADPTQAPGFAERFGESKVVDEDGAPLRIFHGTTGAFERLDIAGRGQVEADLGRGFYATNSVDDANANYAGLGPDITQRIELQAERMQFDSLSDEELAEAIGERSDIDFADLDADGRMAIARQIAREQLGSVHQGAIVPIYLRIENPAVIGGPDETVLELETEFDEEGDFVDESGTLLDFIQSLRAASTEFDDANADQAVQDLLEDGETEIPLSRLIEKLKASEGLMHAMDMEQGDLAVGEVIRAALEGMGFDGIIDNTVNDKFGTNRTIGQQMAGVDEDTVHYIAFSSDQVIPAYAPQELFQPAYHGSPHNFDEFTLDHIGTGEGAQAFGWGLYFADRKAIANYYRESLIPRSRIDYFVDGEQVTFENSGLASGDGFIRRTNAWAQILDAAAQSPEALEEQVQFGEELESDQRNEPDFDEQPGLQASAEAFAREKEFAKSLRGKTVTAEKSKPVGQLFEVDIPESNELLDWDKPLSEQPEGVREKLVALFRSMAAPVPLRELSGAELQRVLAQNDPNGNYEFDEQTGEPLTDADLREQLEITIEQDPDFEQELNEYRATGLGAADVEITSTVEPNGRIIYRDESGQMIASALPGVEDAPDQLSVTSITASPFSGTLNRTAVDAEQAAQVVHRWWTGERNYGRSLYEALGSRLGSPEDASKALLAAGIPGLQYESGQLSGGKSGGKNFVIWDQEAINVLNTFFSRQAGQAPLASTTFIDGEAIMRMGAAANLTSFLHEAGHVFIEGLGKLSQNPNAPQQVKDDYAALIAAAGLKPGQPLIDPVAASAANAELAAARESGDEKAIRAAERKLDQVNRHAEKLVKMWESYLAQGKAPSVALESAFARFKAWFLSVVRDFQRLFGHPPPQDVQDVFDRMLATEEQIEEMKLQHKLAPLWTETKPEGMTERDWERYVALRERVDAEAKSKVLADEMKRFEREQKRDTKERFAAEKERVEAELRRVVTIQARQWLTSGRWIAYEGDDPVFDGNHPQVPHQKLDQASMRAKYGDEIVDSLPRAVLSGKTVQGISDDEVGELFGVEPTQLVRSLVGTETFANSVKAETERRVAATEPTDVEVADAAIDALHRDPRSRLIALEGDLLRKMRSREALEKGSQRRVAEEGAQPASARAEAVQAAREALEAAQTLVAEAREAGDPEAITQAEQDATDAVTALELAQTEQDAARTQRVAESRQLRLQREVNSEAREGRTRNQFRKQMDETAERTIARTPLHQIRPESHVAAQKRAGRALRRAEAKNDIDEAIKQSDLMLYHHFLYRKAKAAKAKALKTRQFFRKKNTKGTRLKLNRARSGYLDLWDLLRTSLGFSQSLRSFQNQRDTVTEGSAALVNAEDEASSFTELADHENELMSDLPYDWIKADKIVDAGKHWQELTPSELDIIDRAARNLIHLGTEGTNITVEGEKFTHDQVVDGIVTVLDTLVPLNSEYLQAVEEINAAEAQLASMQGIETEAELAALEQRIVDLHKNAARLSPNVDSQREKLRAGARNYTASKINPGQALAVAMGAGVEGSLAHEFFGGGATDVNHAFNLRSKEVKLKLDEMYGIYSFGELTKFNWTNRFGDPIYVPEIRGTLTHSQRVNIGFHTGTESNLERVLHGENWTMRQLNAVLDKLTEKDWQFIRAGWELIGAFGPEIKEFYRQQTGVDVKLLPSRDVVTKFGTFKGGYFPVVYDSRKSVHTKDIAAQSAPTEVGKPWGNVGSKLTTDNHFTMQRTAKPSGAHLRFEMDVMHSHLLAVMLDLTHREFIRTRLRVVNDTRFRDAMIRSFGVEFYRQFKPWLRSMAGADMTPSDTASKWIRMATRNQVTYSMFWSVPVMAQQITGLMPAATKTTPKHMIAAITEVTRNPIEAIAWARANSKELQWRERAWNREVSQDVSKYGLQGAPEQLRHFGNFGIAWTDTRTAAIAWIAGYNHGMQDLFNGDEAKSKRYADSLIPRTQGSAHPKDLVEAQRSDAAAKRLFSTFWTFFGALHGLIFESKQAVRNLRMSKLQFTKIMFATVMLQNYPAQLLAGRGPEEWDDPEAWAKWFAWASIDALASPYLYIRDLAYAFQFAVRFGGRGDVSFPASQSISAPVKLAAELADAVTDAIADEEIDIQKITRASFDTITLTTGIPIGSRQLWRVYDATLEVMDEEDTWEQMRMFMYGPRKGRR